MPQWNKAFATILESERWVEVKQKKKGGWKSCAGWPTTVASHWIPNTSSIWSGICRGQCRLLASMNKAVLTKTLVIIYCTNFRTFNYCTVLCLYLHQRGQLDLDFNVNCWGCGGRRLETTKVTREELVLKIGEVFRCCSWWTIGTLKWTKVEWFHNFHNFLVWSLGSGSVLF